MITSSGNKVEEKEERPEGLCKNCSKTCWYFSVVVACSEFKNKEVGVEKCLNL